MLSSDSSLTSITTACESSSSFSIIVSDFSIFSVEFNEIVSFEFLTSFEVELAESFFKEASFLLGLFLNEASSNVNSKSSLTVVNSILLSSNV